MDLYGFPAVHGLASIFIKDGFDTGVLSMCFSSLYHSIRCSFPLRAPIPVDLVVDVVYMKSFTCIHRSSIE